MTNKNLIISLIATALLTVFGFFLLRQDKLPPVQITFLNEGNVAVEISAEIAKTKQELAKGLSRRKEIPENQGMLFLFEEEQFLAFWMKDTLIPLDLIFLNKDKQIVKIVKSAQPCEGENCPSYFSDFESQYVIETKSGFCDKYQINEASAVDFSL
ncbi:DUF192 domain-containing protein [Candidatus Parcubacteria bacterium]|nr:DUF192 domain-containing protein [Candidatus Parcubacteria bacterium]